MYRYKLIILTIFTIILGAISIVPAFGSTRLISDKSQLWSNAIDPAYPIDNLLDDKLNTVFITRNDVNTEQHYLTVTLPEDFSMSQDNENLVVVLTRPNRLEANTPTVRNPTAMEVHYSLNGKDWEDDVLCRVYFINRGSGTTELSEPLPYAKLNDRINAITPGKTINDVKALKFIVTMNNGKYIIGKDDDGKGIRPMILAGFQIYKAIDGEKVVGRWVDRFHLDTDINKRYYNYKFVNTQGPLHEANRKSYGDNGEGILDSLGGWEYFAKTDSAEWLLDKEYLAKHGINMPDFSFITSKNDTLITNPNLKLQRTATVEHVLYAVQGEPIALLPFYTLPYNASYNENFMHWYDYTTGKQVEDLNHTELLDFAVDASGVFRSKNHGWYASSLFRTDEYETYEEKFTIRSVDDYKRFVDKVNNEGIANLSVELLENLDFKGETIDPIGTVSSPWSGKFIGNNKTISNIVIKGWGEGVGLFGNVTDGALIENLIIDKSCKIEGQGWVGVVGILRVGGTLTLQGVINHADVNATGNVGGLLGGVQSETPKDVVLNIFNCAFTGKIINKKTIEQGLVAGWLGRGKNNADKLKIHVNFKNIILSGSHTQTDAGMEIYRYKKGQENNYVFNIDTASCYEVNGYQGWSQYDTEAVNTSDFLENFAQGEWTVGPNGFPLSKIFGTEIEHGRLIMAGGINPGRQHGTYATFMHPRDPFADSGDMRELCKDEFIIAADMAQGFNLANNVNDKDSTIIEPTIQFRHIFRVKDGKQFADSNMADEKGNREFIRKNLRHITATAGTYFQVRLDFPYPVESTTRGVFYYKIDNTDYRRICSRYFRVYKDGELIQDRDEETGKMWVYNKSNIVEKQEDAIFYATAIFDGQGSRNVDGINYYLCGGGGHFYRMMACNEKNATSGRYTVQVVGTDYEGHTIKLADSPDVDLLVQEFQITFLPEESAVLATEEDLKSTYPQFTNENLEKRYGAPSDVINFDEYRFLEVADSLPSKKPEYYLTEIKEKIQSQDSIKESERQTGKYFRWPLSWEQSNYGFGYNVRGDYAMQMIVNNQTITPYHSLPVVVKGEQNKGEGRGLFDRLFYDSNYKQKGYFYYVNAADDPGIIARLKLKTFCPGSKIHVSCWIAEFSHSEESANLSINFVARMKNGERIPLHSHITGYLEQGPKRDDEYIRRGRWLYVYSSFVPILTDKDFDVSQIDHYEVELDNNAKSSAGADYAVDDIRVYTVKPNMFADQLSPVCMESKSIDVRLSSDFEVLLQSLDTEEAFDPAEGDTIDLYYTFLDKKKYEHYLSIDSIKYNEAFDKSVLRFKYDGTNESYYGKLSFFTNFNKHEEYNPASSHNANYAFRMEDAAGRRIVFNTDPSDKTMQPGKEYIAVMLTKPAGTTFENDEPDSMDFLVEDSCAKKCTFTVQSSHVIKVNGEVRNQSDEIDACKNQMPVVQVDLYAPKVDDNGNIIPGETELVERDAIFDWFDGSMDDFVEIQDENGITLWDALIEFRNLYPDAKDLSDSIQGNYTEAMKNLIAKYSKKDPEGMIREKLYLAKAQYNFPPLILPEGQTQMDAYVLAIPIPRLKDEKQLICTQPTQVRIVVKERAPRLAQGIFGIEYPPAISDVPLRISLKQIENAVSGSSEERPLYIPFYKIIPVTNNVDEMRTPIDGAPIELVGSTDPNYKNLKNDPDSEEEGLWIVGEVISLNANKTKVSESIVSLIFNSEIKFREGYEYILRFPFEEDARQVSDEKVCSGDVVFTVKIVPEYQKWIGVENLNWNNDANWRRVSANDISLGNPADSNYADYNTDGTNSNESSYAPLDFTKVVIPKGSSVPELFSAYKETAEMQGNSYDWNKTPSENKVAGNATERVQYDMVQRVESNGTYCKPWQAHWCDQIHFEPGAEIGHQQFLNYNKAWVDIEVSPTRWYTLSSPLQGVVAGDMYLPSNNARQATTYFDDITFNTTDYNRFKPAVFQRSWNLASAIVYNYNDIPENTTDVKILTTWSNVYNDVRVPYSAGHGFSIKTDLAGVNPGETGKVKFRLPKADASYFYYTDGGASGDQTPLNRINPHKLNSVEGIITVEAATDDNKLFLIGNPFMAHMDIAAFLTENSNVIAPKYWILDGAHQGAAVMGDAMDLSGTLENPQYIAPMQGFFVEAIKPGKSLKLKYNADMMATVNDIDILAGVQIRSRAAAGPMALRISAKETGSSAMILFDGLADKGYNASEDVMFVADATLESPSLIYTVADGTATTINTLPEITSTEIGVIANDDEETILLFEGIDSSSGLMVYDAVNDSYTQLYDGLELKVSGSSSRRLYLVSGIVEKTTESLEITLMSNAVRVTSVNGGLRVNIYDINGRTINHYNEGGTEALFQLDQGLFIVEAVDSISSKTQKILIR
ncbi:MAG: hypothetical protein NC343_05220 [Muribaculum sp.]|nr:hypothetical protein [Muribaculaceae bacterium]MCM1081131.1 hypothetical protein [Muribaculum sp.]